MNIPIIFEDEHIVVIDKPSGVVVNRAETVREETIQDWMNDRFKIQDLGFTSNSEDIEYFKQRGGVVHRLDRETSGVMILAKTPEAFVELLRQFKAREVKKEYIALTHGMWKEKHGTITALVGRMRHNRKLFGVREDGRESSTSYYVEAEFGQGNYPKEMNVDVRGYSGFSLVRFLPKTGRTHQIRVHAQHMNHPLVGDFVYAGRKRSREDRKWAQRVMLQAQRLQLKHPVDGRNLVWESTQDFMSHVRAYLTIRDSMEG